MATQELFTVMSNGIGGINLSFDVGPMGTNDIGDVMAVQALLNFIAIGNNDSSETGTMQIDDLPDVTGIYVDGKTNLAIISFQLRWLRLLRSSVAGWMYPVDNKTFQVKDFSDKRPTIVMMNQLAETAAGRMNQQYPHGLMAMFPELRAHLR